MTSRRSHRRSTAVLSGLTTLALLGGSYASFTSQDTAPEQLIGSGTLSLRVVPGVDAGPVSQPIANMAAGDTVVRFLDLLNDGSLDIGGVEVSQTNLASALVTDPDGVELQLDECSVPWDAVTGVCAGVEGVALAATSLDTWTAGTDLLLDLDLAAGSASHLMASWHLPGEADNSLQALADEVKLTFGAVQRDARYGEGDEDSGSSSVSLDLAGSSADADGTYLRWSAPLGQVDGYRVYAGQELVTTTRATQVDLAAPDGPTTYRVVAFGGDGPVSEGSVTLAGLPAYQSAVLASNPYLYVSGTENMVGGYTPAIFGSKAPSVQLVEIDGLRLLEGPDRNGGSWSMPLTDSALPQQNDQYSVEFWASIKTRASDFNVLSFGPASFQAEVFRGDLRARVQTTGGTSTLERRYADDSVLHHYVMTFDSGTSTLYVDGVAVDTEVRPGAGAAGPDSRVPQLGFYGSDVRAGEVAMYDRALTPAEITAHHDAAGS